MSLNIDATAVSAKKIHVFQGKTLAVHYLPDKEQYEMNKLLLKGVPESVNRDNLIWFLDGKLDLEHEVDYILMLKDTSALMLFERQFSIKGISIIILSCS